MIHLIFAFFCFSIFGYNYPCVDINFSPYAGAENFLFLEGGLEKVDDLLFDNSHVKIENLNNIKALPELAQKEQWLRYAKQLLVWLPVNASCAVTQHEVFGHGYRARDLGEEYAHVTGYGIYVVTGLTEIDTTDRLTPSQMLTIDIAGLEADAILANRLRMRWLNEGQVDGRQFILYFIASQSLTAYTWGVHKNPKSAGTDGNDISSFLFYLRKTYPDTTLGYARLRNLALLNLLDPFLLYALLSQSLYMRYDAITPILLSPKRTIQFLPSFHIALTPFGVQGYLEGFFFTPHNPAYTYLKWGKNGRNMYYGAGAEHRRLLSWSTGALGARLDVWHQPRVLFEPGLLSANELSQLPAGAATPPLYPDSLLYENITGVAASLIGSYEPSRLPIRCFMELGYKTEGYLPGEALRSAPIARGGVSGQF